VCTALFVDRVMIGPPVFRCLSEPGELMELKEGRLITRS